MEDSVRRRAIAIFLSSVSAGTATAAITEISPTDDLRAAIAALKPGDELVLRGGTYAFNSRFHITVAGSASQPIVIRAKEGERPLIRMDTTSQNIVDIDGSQHLVLRGIRFQGGSHGIRLINSDFITIEDNEVFDTDDVAISANSGGTYDGLVIRRNHIHHTNHSGEGLYLGCQLNACRVANSVIEWNYIHHTNGPTVQQGDGIELKEGSYGNVIRHNVIHDTNYPGIITYSTVGNGAANIIEGNVIWNTDDYAIQSAADAIIRNNIVLGAPIVLQSHDNGSPSNHVVVHNTVITDGSGIEVRNVVGPVTIANNAVYSSSGTAIRLISGNIGLVTVAGNVGTGGISGTSGGFANVGDITRDFIAANYNGAPPVDLFPRVGSALIGAASSAHVVQLDFNGTSRNGAADAGAYKFESTGNPGWTIAAGFKAWNMAVKPNPPTNLTVQ